MPLSRPIRIERTAYGALRFFTGQSRSAPYLELLNSGEYRNAHDQKKTSNIYELTVGTQDPQFSKAQLIEVLSAILTELENDV